jgi:hypothetical protein
VFPTPYPTDASILTAKLPPQSTILPRRIPSLTPKLLTLKHPTSIQPILAAATMPAHEKNLRKPGFSKGGRPPQAPWSRCRKVLLYTRTIFSKPLQCMMGKYCYLVDTDADALALRMVVIPIDRHNPSCGRL